MSRFTWPMVVFAIGIGMQVGCGPDPKQQRVGVSGRVTFKGEPLANGMIMFVKPAGIAGRETMGKIADGHYSIPREAGPQPGKYDVRIVGVEIAGPGAGSGVIPAAKISKRFNDETILHIVVPARNEMEYSFDVEGE